MTRKRTAAALAAGGIAALVAHAGAAVIYVDKDATGADDGTSWTDAYADLVDALGAASSGDDIWIAEGTYVPTNAAQRPSLLSALASPTAAQLARTRAFVVPGNVSLYGGFSGTETAIGQRTLSATATVLSGDFDGDDAASYANRGENAINVVVLDGSSGDVPTMDLLTVTGGNAAMYDSFSGFFLEATSRGGGVHVLGGGLDANDVRIVDNIATAEGGGIYITASSNAVTFDDCVVSENVVNIFTTPAGQNRAGLGMYVGYDTGAPALVLNDCTISDNDLINTGGAGLIELAGGGVYSARDVEADGCTFSGNRGGTVQGMSGAYAGSAIFSSDITVTDCTFTNNTYTCAIGFWGDVCDVYAADCVFTDNSANTNIGLGLNNGGAAIAGDYITAIRCTFEGNTSNLGGAVAGGGGEGTLTDCIFVDNEAYNSGGGYGGAIYGYFVIDRCEFRGNEADNGGAVAYPDLTDDDQSVSNSLFAGNDATLGGAILIDDSDTDDVLTVTNCTFTGNSANAAAAVSMSGIHGELSIVNSVLWDNSDVSGTEPGDQLAVDGTTTVSYTTINDSTSSFGGTGMSYTDPDFIEPTNGDYRLSNGSPAMDEGDNSAVVGTQDLSGLNRILRGKDPNGMNSPVVDMGAYERCIADIDGNGTYNQDDLSDFTTAFSAADPLADLDGSGTVNLDDLDIFIAAALQGCAP